MSQPKVTVVIPAYNQAEFLGEAIQSVLNQTFADFEIIVVNDASPDHTAEVVKQFDDPRLRYIRHEVNRGLPATRNTGMRAAKGELIALLDADDLFHSEKLQAHVDYLTKHPGIGVSYNNRFDLNYSMKTIRSIYRTPHDLRLRDFVLGFPFAPSDMVIRKDWAYNINCFNEIHRHGAEDIDFPCRLALAGCQFGRVDQAFNYRRYHSGRIRKNIRLRMEDALMALNNVFNDTRCPPEVLDLQDVARKNHYEILSYTAFVQGETQLGQELLREAARLVPTIITGYPSSYVEMLARRSSADENFDHQVILQGIFPQLPEEFSFLPKQLDWAVGRGYVIKAVRAMMWGKDEDGIAHFAQATKNNAYLDKIYARNIAHQLLNYASEFDYPSANQVLDNIAPYVKQIGKRSSLRSLKGYYFVNQAFELYRTGDHSTARRAMGQALLNQPGYLANRGVVSVLIRSIASKNPSNKFITRYQAYGRN